MASGELIFNSNIYVDPTAKYWLYYTQDFDTSGATLINSIEGFVTSSSITFNFTYSALTSINYTAVAISIDQSQYVTISGVLYDDDTNIINIFPNNELMSSLTGISWVEIYDTPTSLSGYSISVNINDLSDVNTSGVTTGQYLSYSAL